MPLSFVPASFYECSIYGSSAPAVALHPTNLPAVASGSSLVLSWSADPQGWRLQVQTNTLLFGLGTNWLALVGAELVTSTNLTNNSGLSTAISPLSGNRQNG